MTTDVKRDRRAFVAGLVATAGSAGLMGQALAQPAPGYAGLAGTWTGEQVRNAGGRFRMVIQIEANGSYTWTREGAFLTAGQLSGSGRTLGYANQAGSRGTVNVSGNTLVWRNTQTGNDYTVTVRR
jgi:hypothetical protein